jgi:hypothetical protein
MALLNFPLNPTVGQKYSIPGTTTVYTWNGFAWQQSSSGNQTFGNVSVSSSTFGVNPGSTVSITTGGSIIVNGGTLTVNNNATLGNLNFTASSIVNTLNDLIIQSAKDTKIVLNNDTLVSGNLHATGNITAAGSVQVGNMTGSDTLSLFAEIVSDIIPQTANTYSIGSEEQTWANAYVNNLIAGSMTGLPGQDVNISPGPGSVTNINSNIRVWGDNPLGTGPVTSNVLYVTMDGSDTNDGRSMDPTRACRTISGAVRSPFYKEGTSIKVSPGHYYENNPIELKPLTSVIGSDLRTTFIEPIHKTQDLFWVKSGNYLAQMQFSNGQSGLLPGIGYNSSSNRGAYAVAFKPNYGNDAKIDVFYSPYIQNCTNQSGPWLYDGTMFRPNQTVQIPSGVGQATWVSNTTTMLVTISEGVVKAGDTINVGPTPIDYVNARTLLLANKPFIQEQVIAYIDINNTYYQYDKVKCRRDTGIIIDSLISDLVFRGNGFTQSNFAGLQYWNQAGYVGAIAGELTTTTNAINFVSGLAQKIIKNDTSGTRYATVSTQTLTGFIATQTEANTIAADFGVITTILSNGTAGVTDIIVPNGTTAVSTVAQYAYTNLQLNKAYLIDQTIAYIESTKTPLFSYDQTKCRRDVGYMIDSVGFDLLYGGNRQAIQSGVYYYGFSGTASAIANERPQTTAAYYRIKSIIENILLNQPIVKSEGNISTQDTTSYPAATSAEVTVLKSMVDKITEIINAGPDAADTPVPISSTATNTASVTNAVNIIKANKSFITIEVINYIDQLYSIGFVYNQPKCARDTGLIVESIAVDLLYNGQTQSNFSGLQYWNQAGYTGLISSELTTTSNAVNYVSSLAQQVISNTTGTRYQNTVSQVTTIGTTATSIEIAKVASEFSVINSIILNGTVGVTDIIESNGVASTTPSAIASYNLLQSNKSFIEAETIAYINTQHDTFNQAKCLRDTKLLVDAVAQDLLFNGISQSTFAGIQYWNQAGYTGAIPNEITTTTAAINYVSSIAAKVVLNDLTGTRYSTGVQVANLSPATGAEATAIVAEFGVITNILTNGTAGVTDIIVPNGLVSSANVNVQRAYAILQANKLYLEQEAVAYVELVKPVGFQYDPAKCARDVGYMIDSIAFDLLYGGNRQAVQSGVYYYGYSSTARAIPANELSNTLSAYKHLRDILPYIVENAPIPVSYQTSSTLVAQVFGTPGTTAQVITAQSAVDVITNIITNGPSVAATPSPISLTSSADANVIYASTIIEANRNFIAAEVVAYISSQLTGFVYDQVKCARDIGYMLDSVSFDLLHGGNRQAVQSGVYYYNFNGSSSAIGKEIPQTVAAYNHIRNIVGKVITGQQITTTAGNAVKQVTSLPSATTATLSVLYSNLDLITNIINNGPSAAITPTPIGLTASTNTNIVNAYNLLIANKSFIQAETIAYVNQLDTGFVYNRAKCFRDVGIILENIAYDVAFGGNEKSVEAGLAYWSGVTSVIPTEITQTTAAITYIDTLAQSVIANVTATNLLNTYQTSPQVINTVVTNGATAGPAISKLAGIINGIIINGPSSAPVKQIGNGPDWGSVSAEVLLQSNRKFIQNEVINWINQVYPNFVYAQERCYRDTGLIVDAISQDIILNSNAKTVEAGVTYWTGGKSVIANAKFGNPNQVTETQAAIARAKQISLQIINNTTVTSSSFVFNSTKCSRDTGLIVDALAQDLLFGGSSQSTFSGIQYWNHGSYVGKIAGEITTTTAAINYLKSIAQKAIIGDTTGIRYQSTVTQVVSGSLGTAAEQLIIGNDFTVITDILTTGTTGITDVIVPNSLTASNINSVKNSYALLQANKQYFQAEVEAWIQTSMQFKYDPVKCARDTGIIVDSIALDLAYPTSANSQSTFAGLQYWSQAGYTGAIAGELTTTTNAINYVSSLAQKVILNNLSGVRYQSGIGSIVQNTTGTAATISEVTKLSSEFTTIVNILTSGTTGVTDQIVANGIAPLTTSTVQNAYASLQANKAYIQAEAVAFVEATKAPGFVYDKTLCARDVGYMLDSVSFDLLHGGNRQAIQSGVYYFSFNSNASAIPTEIPQTIAAFEFIKILSNRIIRNIPVTPLQTTVQQVTLMPVAGESAATAINNEASRIISIIENGPDVVGVKSPISLVASTDANRLNAANNLTVNREFIKAETIAYINNKLTFQYDKAKCSRDVAYIVDSVSFDLLYGGNRQAIQSGVYYWGYNGVSTSLPKEQVASTNAYEYMKVLVSSIVTATPLLSNYSGATQVTGLPAATSAEVAIITDNIDKITNIINNGPKVAGAPTNIPLTRSNNAFVNNAAALLAANRDFIKSEVIAYVQSTVNSQVFLPFYDKGANATLSVIRNYDIISNIIEGGPSLAPSVFEGNGIFVKTGLSRDDVRIAPVVTNVTSLGNNQYQVDISESTVGFGDSQTLYFGQTAVYPLLDPDVPDRWQQRRLNAIGSNGGALIDGGVISDRSPIQSFVFDAFTQLNQGGNGVKITNNGYAQLVSVFTIFCSNAVTVENGGICSITNSNSNFGDICLSAKGYGKREFSGYVYNPPVAPYYPQGVYPQQGAIQVYIADPKLRPHIALVMEIEPPADYKNLQGFPGFVTGNSNVGVLVTGTINISGVDTTGIVIGQSFYVRDQYGKTSDTNNQPYVKPGTIVSDVNFETITLNYPLNSGGGDPNNANYFNLFSCGKAYYTVLSSTVSADPVTPGTFLLPGLQGQAEINSINYLNSLTQKIILNQSVTPLQTATSQVFDFTLSGVGAGTYITSECNLINSILKNGPTSAPAVTKTGPTVSSFADAAGLLTKNRSFLQDEIISYVDSTYLTFVYDQDKCYRDTGLIVDAIAQDLVFGGTSQSTFAGIQYWNQSGYVGAIASELTPTIGSINYVKVLAQEVLQNITAGIRFQSTATQNVILPAGTVAEAAIVGADFDVITSILTNGTANVTNIIVPNSLTKSGISAVQNAFAVLQANKAYIQAEAVAYVEKSRTPTFTYNQAKCYRDVGYMIDSICIDLLYGGNRQAIQSGVYYYGFSSTSSAIPGESIQIKAAYNHIKAIIPNIILGTTVTTYQSVVPQVITAFTGTNATALLAQGSVDVITNIIANGPSSAAAPTSLGLVPSVTTDVVNAGNLLESNRTFIQAETIAYINNTFGKTFTYNQTKCARDTGLIVDALAQDLLFSTSSQATFAGIQYWNQTSNFTYNQVKCSRDTGLIVDAITQDLLFGGQTQATFSGVQYWNHGSYVGAIANELTTTTNAIAYVRDLAAKVILNDTSGVRYQSTATQNISGTIASAFEQATIVNDFNVILSIINSGVAGITDAIIPNGIVASGTVNVQNAYATLQANRAYIQAEAVAYVNATKTAGFIYDQTKCARDVGYMVDSVSFDLLYTGNLQAIESGVYYYSFNGTSTALPGEQAVSIQAYNYLKSLLSNIITATPIASPYQTATAQVTSGTPGTSAEVLLAQSEISVITDIISNGPSTAQPGQSIGLTRSVNANVINAATLIHANRNFLRAETVAFVNSITKTGYVGAIASEITTTTNTINYVNSLAKQVIQNISGSVASGTRYQTTLTQISGTIASSVEANAIDTDFKVILDILANGTVGVTNKIIPNNLTANININVVRAYNLLQANKTYIQTEAVAYVENSKTPGFIYDSAKCYRDVGFMIDSVSFDLLYGGNRQAIQSGVYYFAHNGASTAVPNEIIEVTAAYDYIKSITQQIVLGQSVTTYQSAKVQITNLPTGTAAEAAIVKGDVDVITNIINNGPGVALPGTPIPQIRSTSTNVINAAKMLEANREFIVAEVISYINRTFGAYNKDKCRRDVGLLVDALSYDLANGGNYNAIVAGKSYYATAGTHHLVQLEENVTDVGLFPNGSIVNFYQRSYMSASGYLFEYVGAGTNYGALPQVGVADPVQSKETVQLNNGKVFFTSTDQNGDFRIGTGLVISQATGVLSGRTFTKSLFANLTPFILAIEGI